MANFSGNSSLVFAKGALATTLVTTFVWLVATFVTAPEPEEILVRFYKQVRPDVRGWKRIAALVPGVTPYRDLGHNLWAWAIGCAMVYMCLFGAGKILLHQPGLGIALLVGSAICAVLLYQSVIRNFKTESQEELGGVPDWAEPAPSALHH